MQITSRFLPGVAATIPLAPTVKRTLSATSLVRGAIALGLIASTAALPAVAEPGSAAARSAIRAPERLGTLVARPAPHGRQPLAFVVHPTHPPVSLDYSTAFGIASGRIADWREIDGRNAPLRLVAGPAAASRLVGLWFLLGRIPASIRLGSTDVAA